MCVVLLSTSSPTLSPCILTVQQLQPLPTPNLASRSHPAVNAALALDRSLGTKHGKSEDWVVSRGRARPDNTIVYLVGSLAGASLFPTLIY